MFCTRKLIRARWFLKKVCVPNDPSQNLAGAHGIQLYQFRNVMYCDYFISSLRFSAWIYETAHTKM